MLSERSGNIEEEKVTFNTLKTFTNLTSNQYPQIFIINLLVRLQAKKILEVGKTWEEAKNGVIFFDLDIKVELSPSKEICVSLCLMKNAFYLILKAYFVLKIFKSFS